MSCQKILSLLSVYMDGEAEARNADAVEKHLATCASCAREFEALRRTAGMLRTTAEIEPPASLLAQIETATVNQPGFRAKLLTAFATWRMPQQARWLAAGAAATGVLIGILVSHPGTKQTAPTPTASAPPSAGRLVTSQPADIGVQGVEAPSARSASPAAAIGRPVRATHFHKKTHRWRTKTVAKAPKFPERPAAVEPESGIETESSEPSETASDEGTLVADAAEPTEAGLAAGQASKAEETKVEAIKSDLEARLKRQAEALEKFRAQIAASRRGKYLSRTEGTEGRKYSVELAIIWF